MKFLDLLFWIVVAMIIMGVSVAPFLDKLEASQNNEMVK
jgi:phosphoribosyl-ATP pyrophosphohydrolase